MTWSPWLSVSQWNLLCLLTAWCSACPWSPRGWSSPSASLYTVWSSLWSRSSECGGGAQSCRRRSPPGLARRRLCHLRRLSRCSSDAAWSYDPSPAGPSVWKHTNTLSLSSLFLAFSSTSLAMPPLFSTVTPDSCFSPSLCTCLSLSPLEVFGVKGPGLLYLGERYAYRKHKVT